MEYSKNRFPFGGVVLVADLVTNEPKAPIDTRRDLEQTDQDTLDDLSNAIRRLGLELHHYEHPQFLAENAGRHAADMILSIFGGEVSRSRMALVPAVCESMGLSYIGPDAYGRIICQDKEVSKAIAAEVGLRIPLHRIVRSRDDLPKLVDFPLPCVAKPLWEGSSIGIGPANLIKDTAEGQLLVDRMLKQFAQPIMVESFAPGKEVSYCFVEGPENLRSFAESVWGDDEDHFDFHLYDSAHKSKASTMQIVRCINEQLDRKDAEAMERLITLLSPLGYGRIDGKLKDGQFTFLEVTPDAWLGSNGTFINSFSHFGLSFDDVIAKVLASGRLNRRNRLTNG